MSAGGAPRQRTTGRGAVLALSVALGLAAGLVALWLSGGAEGVVRWAMDGQREAQAAMAGALRRLRAAEPGAWAALMGLTFAYGVLHAVGPGHGKVLIGGYGAATRVPLARLAGIALLASLAQATTAVALVHGAVAVLDWGRTEVVGLGEGALTTASTAAIGAIGLWLAGRGVRGLLRRRPAVPAPPDTAGSQGPGRAVRPASLPGSGGHGAGGPHGPVAAIGVPAAPPDPALCAACGHRHGPDPAAVARLGNWREAAALIAAIAIRPCTGALFLLVLTWRMDISAAGIAGTYAMGLGTGLVTVAVAALSVLARDGARMWAQRLGGLGALGPALEVGVGLLVALGAAQALRLGL